MDTMKGRPEKGQVRGLRHSQIIFKMQLARGDRHPCPCLLERNKYYLPTKVIAEDTTNVCKSHVHIGGLQ